MIVTRFKRESFEVSIAFSRPVVDFLKHYTQPFFEAQDGPHQEGTWLITTHEHAPFVANEPPLQDVQPIPGEPTRALSLYPTARVIIIESPSDNKWQAQTLMRLIRKMGRLQSSQRHMFLHGGLVRYKGKGIVVAGPKRSGKTTTLLKTLIELDCDFISNDDVSLVIESGKLVGYGWPRAVSIRKDVAQNLGLARLLQNGHLAPRHPANDRRSSDSPLFLYPEELATLTHSKVLPRQDVDAIVFPSFHNEAHSALALLAPEDFLAKLDSNMESQPNKFFDLDETFMPQPATSRTIAADLAWVSQNIAGFCLSQNMDHLDHTIKELNAWVIA